MTARRIVPCLDVKDGRVVKGVKFVGHTDMGDAAELAARYRDAGADELVFYDITASPEGRTLTMAGSRTSPGCWTSPSASPAASAASIRPPAAWTTARTRSRSTLPPWNAPN